MGNENKTLELQIRIAAEDAARVLSSLKGEIQTLASEANKFAGTDGAALKKSFKDAEAAAKESASSIGEIKKTIMSLAEVVAATKALGVIKDMGAFALQTADNFQTMKNQFGILLGDMQAGAGLFNEIKAFNDKTPFDMGTLTQATNVLISAKVPLQDLQAQLTKFGDLSQGNSQKMTSYVNAFSQAAAKGKADMQVLNAYLHQGVPILDELAKNFHVTTAEIAEMSGQGQISFKDFSKALDDLTASGGQYFGGMELASKSLAAMQEGLREAVNSLAASFGDMLLPAATGVTGTLTDLANAVNESPILKGLLTGALVAITGYLGAMAVKVAIAFAAQMKLNLAVGALNPAVLAATVAVAAMAAGYAVYASKAQAAAKESEEFNMALRKKSDALIDAAAAVREYANAFAGMSGEDVARKMRNAALIVNALNRDIQEKQQELDRIRDRYRKEGRDFLIDNTDEQKKLEMFIGRQRLELDAARANLDALRQGYDEYRRGVSADIGPTDWIEKMFGGTQEAKIMQINEQLATASRYLSGNNLSESDRTKLQAIVRGLNEELQRLQNKGEDINRMAAEWRKSWAELWGQHKADRDNDPFYRINLEQRKKIEEAYNNYVRDAEGETIRQVNEYYKEEREKIIRQLADEERRIQADLSKSKIDNLEYEYEKALGDINRLEARRVIAAAGSAKEIERIRRHFEEMRATLDLNLENDKLKATLDEAREAVRDWQRELSDDIALALMGIKGFSGEASVLIGDMAARLASISLDGLLNVLKEIGRAFANSGDAGEDLAQALADMAKQILDQLPMMFLQAGLQLIASGQWALGLGLIAAAGSTAIISGYVDERSNSGGSGYAKGGVFDEYGRAAREFAVGGAFTNQIVSSPTHFAHGGGLGLMGEAGPEAIMPLTRMPNGDLGVQAAGGGASVTVNITNNSGAEVRHEETETADGGRQIDIVIGDMVNRHIASGKADRAMGRYGIRAGGV